MNSTCQDMLRKAKEIMKRIINLGYEAYLVGPSVREISLNLDFKVLEIFTTIPENEFKKAFADYHIDLKENGGMSLGYLSHKYQISFPHQYKFQSKLKVKKVQKHYSKALIDFLCTKDYSIDAMSMSCNNIVYDPFSGKEDMRRKKIKTIYVRPKVLYENEPKKILELFKRISETGYKPDAIVLNAIKRKAKRVKEISLEDQATLMRDIHDGKYFKKCLKYIYKSKIYKYLYYFKSILSMRCKSYKHEDLDTFMAMGLIEHKTYEEVVGKATGNEYDFRMLVNLAITNPKPEYDDLTLFSYGLEKCMKANRINYLLGKCRKKGHYIKRKYNSLKVKKPCDLAFKGDDILKLADLTTYEVSIILDDIIYSILEGTLENEYNAIKEKVIHRLRLQEGLYNNQEVNNQNTPNPNLTEYTNLNANNIESNKNLDVNNGLNMKGLNANVDLDNNYNHNNYDQFAIIKQKQLELESRLKELENQSLARELEIEIERKIRESGALKDVHPDAREETKRALYQTYYEMLINSDKYKSLNKFN